MFLGARPDYGEGGAFGRGARGEAYQGGSYYLHALGSQKRSEARNGASTTSSGSGGELLGLIVLLVIGGWLFGSPSSSDHASSSASAQQEAQRPAAVAQSDGQLSYIVRPLQINVRSCPSWKCDSVGTYNRGDKINLDKRIKGDWYAFRYQDGKGATATGYIRTLAK